MMMLKTLKEIIPNGIVTDNDSLRNEARNWVVYLEEQKELVDIGAGFLDDTTNRPLENFFKKEMINSQIKWIKKFFNLE